MKKKLLSTLLVLCLVMSLLPTAAFAAGSEPFTDVDTTDWFYDEVVYVYDNGLMAGTSNTTFTPDTTTTRGMLVTILYRLDGGSAVYTEGTFTDVAAGAYYAEAVEWAAANSIVGGYGNGLFGPNDPLTREQMAAILYRYAQYADVDVSVGEETNILSYADVADVSEYAIPAMQWAYGAGVIGGTSATTLSPKGNATRAQVAVILYRFCEDVLASEDDAEKFTVTFEYNYGSKGTYETVTVEDGETVEKPSNPSRSGYSFSGWYTKASGGSKFDFDTAIDADLTLYAHWSSNSSGSSGGHSCTWSAWTYAGDSTHQRNCSSCGKVETSTCDITWEYDDVEHKSSECTVCGASLMGAHVYDEDGKCVTCGYAKPEINEGITDPEKIIASIGSKGYNSLTTALEAAATMDGSAESPVVILLEKDIDAYEQIEILQSNVKINGNNKTITTTNTDWSTATKKHLVLVTGNNVSMENITLDSNNIACGLQVYNCAGFGIYDSTIKNSENAGFLVNRSYDVMAVGLTAEGNEWGSINVDHLNDDNGRLDVTVFSCDLQDENQIWSEVSFDVVNMWDDGYNKYCYIRETDGQTFYCWTTKEPANCEAMIEDEENGNEYYQTLELALTSVEENTTIEMLSDAVVDIRPGTDLALGNDNTKSITIEGNGNTLTFNKLDSDWNHVATNNDAVLKLNNMTIADSGHVGATWNSYDINFACEVELNNVTTKPLAFKNNATLTTVEISDTSDMYAIWIQPGNVVDIDGLVVDATRGIKIDNQYVEGITKDSNTTLTVKNAIFDTEKKAAILVKTYGDTAITLENVNIEKVAADTFNAVWVDEDAAEYADKVTVAGGSKIVEGAVKGAVREWGKLDYESNGSGGLQDVVLTVYNAEQLQYAMENKNELYDAVMDEAGISTETLLYTRRWCLKLGADIDFDMTSESTAIAPLTWEFGSINGDGHAIRNVYISSNKHGTASAPVKVGLFDDLSTASVRNLELKNIHVSASGNNAYVGTLTGMSQGECNGVSVDGFSVKASSTDAYAGGLFGSAYGNKTDCSVSNGSITAGSSTVNVKNVGGFAGYVCVEDETLTTTLSNCVVSDVDIEAYNESGRNTIGSFAGRLNEYRGTLTLTNCTVTDVGGNNVPEDRIYGDIPNAPVTINGEDCGGTSD